MRHLGVTKAPQTRPIFTDATDQASFWSALASFALYHGTTAVNIQCIQQQWESTTYKWAECVVRNASMTNNLYPYRFLKNQKVVFALLWLCRIVRTLNRKNQKVVFAL